MKKSLFLVVLSIFCIGSFQLSGMKIERWGNVGNYNHGSREAKRLKLSGKSLTDLPDDCFLVIFTFLTIDDSRGLKFLVKRLLKLYNENFLNKYFSASYDKTTIPSEFPGKNNFVALNKDEDSEKDISWLKNYYGAVSDNDKGAVSDSVIA